MILIFIRVVLVNDVDMSHDSSKVYTCKSKVEVILENTVYNRGKMSTFVILNLMNNLLGCLSLGTKFWSRSIDFIFEDWSHNMTSFLSSEVFQVDLGTYKLLGSYRVSMESG